MQPSLRHFAVIGKLRRLRRGSVWQIADRRSSGESQMLLLPSRFISWPILLSRTESLSPAPMRLRNGKVALIYQSQISLESLAQAIRPTKEKVKLHPIRGFESTKVKRPLALLVTPLVLIPILWAFLPGQSTTEIAKSDVVRNRTCSQVPVLGSTLAGANLKTGSIEIAATHFRLKVVHNFGGLTQIWLQRGCDGHVFRYQAWRSSQGLTLGAKY